VFKALFSVSQAAGFVSRRVKNYSLQFVVFAALLPVIVAPAPAQNTRSTENAVTAVQGESWIRHLHRSFGETAMGRTYNLGPAPTASGETAVPWQIKLSPARFGQTTTVHGEDLYRVSCQGCHGQFGSGVPPEIHSVIGPVLATSAAATLEHMKSSGQEMSEADLTALAKESKILLLQRLHLGGHSMLPPTLSEAEIRSLVAYLEQLSGVPGADKKQIAVKQSAYRTGEHIVKSTCHVCHSATGPDPTPQEILQGSIPPLSSLPTRVSLPAFVRKVTNGNPIIMGTPATPYRGRMPVFSYLTQDEAAAAYMYLILYPPQQ
jgi:mono/diheme cytochrome c family protein